MREVGAEAQIDVRPGRERPEAVDVDLDAALDDAGDQPERSCVLLVARLLDERLGLLERAWVVREHDEPAARAVVVDDADEVRAHLEDDPRNLRLLRRFRLLPCFRLGRRRSCGLGGGGFA